MSERVTMSLVISTADHKVMMVSGASGDLLESHKVDVEALLLVKNGNITYEQEGERIVLVSGQGYSIPSDVYHAVHCNEASEIFIIIPKRAKMKFQR